MSVKQVIVVRTKYPDGKGGVRTVRSGKLISQCCHASMMFLSEAVRVCLNDWHDPEHGKVVLSEVQKAWIAGRFTKVCLQVPDEAGLLAIAEEAKKAGLDCHVVTDAGLTEFNGVETKTCLAIGPDEAEKIDAVTGKLQLY